MARRWKVLLVTSVAVFMGFLDVTIVNIAFPDIRASFPHTSLAGLSWVLNAYNVVFAALLADPARLAAMGPTEEEVLEDLTWPASADRPERRP